MHAVGIRIFVAYTRVLNSVLCISILLVARFALDAIDGTSTSDYLLMQLELASQHKRSSTEFSHSDNTEHVEWDFISIFTAYEKNGASLFSKIFVPLTTF